MLNQKGCVSLIVLASLFASSVGIIMIGDNHMRKQEAKEFSQVSQICSYDEESNKMNCKVK